VREPKPEWVQALKALCGSDSDLRWNEQVGRWEFVLLGADGIPRSQFWGVFFDPRTGARLEPDHATGLLPFRDLDDTAMREALGNLERTFIGNREDGAGTTRREMERRIRFNRDTMRRKYQEAGEAFADMAAERGRRIRGAPLVSVPVTLTPRGA
jgi:hypothetical protein